MDARSQDTLHEVKTNIASMTRLWLGDDIAGAQPAVDDGVFNSSDSRDYTKLGNYIGGNTNLQQLKVSLRVGWGRISSYYSSNSMTALEGLYDGLKRNSSISELILHCGNTNLVEYGRGHEVLKILKTYQVNSSHLTILCIDRANLERISSCYVIADTLRSCTNLRKFTLGNCSLSDEQLLPMIEAIGGNHKIEELCLYGHRIGDSSYEAIATTLLEDPNTNLRILNLSNNVVRENDNGAVAIINGLARNTKLEELSFAGDWGHNNYFDESVVDAICRLVCDTSSVNNTYLSNHTLKSIYLVPDSIEGLNKLQSLASTDVNEDPNKSHEAIRKILKHHPNIDMEPLFEWDAEDGERNLKALPYVIGWFNRARAVPRKNVSTSVVDTRKLSAIYEFAKAMPVLFVPASEVKKEGKKKRKRGDDART